eukprot:15444956-Alexandrium_andersonii.AAC.1
MSPQLVGTISRLASIDMQKHNEGLLDTTALESLGNIGTGGTHQENMNKQLMKMTECKNMPEAFTLPGLVRKDAGQALAYTVAEIPLLLPHEAFATLYNKFPGHWAKAICPSDQVVE